MEPMPRIVKMYVASNGDCPFRDFLDDLEHQAAFGYITARIARLRQGAFGDWKSLGDGMGELRVHHGPGYRIYFGIDGEQLVLLCGGKKNRQKRDIAAANRFWRHYCEKKDGRL